MALGGGQGAAGRSLEDSHPALGAVVDGLADDLREIAFHGAEPCPAT